LVRGCGTLGKALVMRAGLCGLWQVCCLGRPHFRVSPKSPYTFLKLHSEIRQQQRKILLSHHNILKSHREYREQHRLLRNYIGRFVSHIAYFFCHIASFVSNIARFLKCRAYFSKYTALFQKKGRNSQTIPALSQRNGRSSLVTRSLCKL
jgi:glutaredoxin-related protein